MKNKSYLAPNHTFPIKQNSVFNWILLAGGMSLCQRKQSTIYCTLKGFMYTGGFSFFACVNQKLLGDQHSQSHLLLLLKISYCIFNLKPKWLSVTKMYWDERSIRTIKYIVVLSLNFTTHCWNSFSIGPFSKPQEFDFKQLKKMDLPSKSKVMFSSDKTDVTHSKMVSCCITVFLPPATRCA